MGRHHIGEDLWANYLVNNLEPDVYYVIDDLRYDNEAFLLRKQGAIIIEVKRAVGPAMPHSSERGIHPDRIDMALLNDGTLEELYTKLRKIWG